MTPLLMVLVGVGLFAPEGSHEGRAIYGNMRSQMKYSASVPGCLALGDERVQTSPVKKNYGCVADFAPVQVNDQCAEGCHANKIAV